MSQWSMLIGEGESPPRSFHTFYGVSKNLHLCTETLHFLDIFGALFIEKQRDRERRKMVVHAVYYRQK
jgi:hypothetical protein